jgi:hypothetical protein
MATLKNSWRNRVLKASSVLQRKRQRYASLSL